MRERVDKPDPVLMIGGAEARLVAEQCGYRWEATAGGNVALVAETESPRGVVVFGTYDELLAVLRLRPRRTIWRPVGQRLPLPRQAPWALRRVAMIVATDDVVARSTLAMPAPTVVIPQAIPASRDPDRVIVDRRSRSGPLRIAIVLDALDHHAAQAMTLVGALARGHLRVCHRCAGVAPFRYSPMTAELEPADRCSCGGPLTPTAPIDVRASLIITDDAQPAWTQEYVTDVMDWLALDGLVHLATRSPTNEPELVEHLATVDVVIAAGSSSSLPRGALLAALAGVEAIVPAHGEAENASWLHRCRCRTETVADDTVRVHLDLADVARSILEMAGSDGLSDSAAVARRTVIDSHDVGHLAPGWHEVLECLRAAPERSLVGRHLLGRPTGGAR